MASIFCEGETRCCSRPVRIDVIVTSCLGILLAGLLSILLWFEFFASPAMIEIERVGFVLAALLETVLLIGSIFGFVGAVVRKNILVQAYAYFLYVHSFLNLGVVAFLLSSITRFSTKVNIQTCQSTVENQRTRGPCGGILKVATWVYYTLAISLLLVEFYATLTITRYLKQIWNEQRGAKALCMENEVAFGLASVSGNKAQYSSIPGGQSIPIFCDGDNDVEDFNPYELHPRPTEGPRSGPSGSEGRALDDIGYGGGLWTHKEISDKEKALLEERGTELVDEERLPTYA